MILSRFASIPIAFWSQRLASLLCRTPYGVLYHPCIREVFLFLLTCLHLQVLIRTKQVFLIGTKQVCFLSMSDMLKRPASKSETNCSKRVRPLSSWELQSPYVHPRRYTCTIAERFTTTFVGTFTCRWLINFPALRLFKCTWIIIWPCQETVFIDYKGQVYVEKHLLCQVCMHIYHVLSPKIIFSIQVQT